MWQLLLLSALAGLVVADQPTLLPAAAKAGDDDHQHGGGLFGRLYGDILNPRLAANSLRIISLDRKLAAIRKKLDEAEKVDPEGFVKEIDARVTHLEGSPCPDKSFQCGGNDQECISDLLVCDGHKDCHNGHDEDQGVCDVAPVKAGNVFAGTSHWTDCLVRHDHVTRITITGTIRRKFFQSRVWVRAHVESDVEVKGHTVASGFDAKGYYSFGRRRLVLVPVADDDHHMSVVCDFDHGDNHRASCRRVLEATLHTCADLHVSLEH